MLTVVPMTIKRANRYVARWHRHHRPTTGGLFAVAVASSDAVCGVAIVGRPSARLFDQRGEFAEITRIATDGTRNACSKLVGLCRRIVQIMGYKGILSYTLPEEGGASLRAAGWKEPVVAGGGSWSRVGRPRVDGLTEEKWRWLELFGAGAAADGS